MCNVQHQLSFQILNNIFFEVKRWAPIAKMIENIIFILAFSGIIVRNMKKIFMKKKKKCASNRKFYYIKVSTTYRFSVWLKFTTVHSIQLWLKIILIVSIQSVNEIHMPDLWLKLKVRWICCSHYASHILQFLSTWYYSNRQRELSSSNLKSNEVCWSNTQNTCTCN